MTTADEKFQAKLAKLETQFEALSSIAPTLNTASNELTEAVGILDEALKDLNVGLTVWVTFRSRGVEDWEFDDDQLGYSKIDGKWGIALRRRWGSHRDDVWDCDGPWLFNDAPRELRLLGVDAIPELVENLGQEAANMAKKVQTKTAQVRELANVIKKGKPQTLAERIAAGQKSLLHPGSKATVKLSDMMLGADAKAGSK